MVRLRPTWTFICWPSTVSVSLPPQYQPKEPVENSLASAISGVPLTVTVTGWAFWRNRSRVIEPLDCVAADMEIPPGRVGLALRVRGVGWCMGLDQALRLRRESRSERSLRLTWRCWGV